MERGNGHQSTRRGRFQCNEFYHQTKRNGEGTRRFRESTHPQGRSQSRLDNQKLYRDRSPIQSTHNRNDTRRCSDERRKIQYRDKPRPRDSSNGIHRMDTSTVITYWDNDHLKQLAKKTEPDIVDIIFNDQKVFFNMLGSDGILKDTHKLKLLIQILYNLTAVPVGSEHFISLLSQITSEKYDAFYMHLAKFIKKMPSEQSITKRDENFNVLKYILQTFHRFLVTIPRQCVILPLNDLLEATKLLQQQQSSRYDEYVTSANKLVELYRESEAMDVDGELFNYRTTPILPNVNEISRRARPKLQANLIEGSYRDWDHYLHVQFSLLREDFISPLRQGICDYRRGYEEQSRQSIRVYKYVRILEPVCLYTGLGFCIQFDVSYGHLRRVEWEHSRRLSFGSLLCLSCDKFASVFFATVVSRDPKLLKDGFLKVQFESTNVLEILEINPQIEFTMVESTAYFEACRHILKRLQMIVDDPPSFRAYIVDCKPQESIQPPSYLKDTTNGNVCFDLSALNSSASDDSLSSVNVLDTHAWPHCDDVSLDKSQLAAVQMALTQELSVIQGPPGTGKTYIGLKIVDILLKNKEIWDPLQHSHILVVCYTNHALDQFLEGILKFAKEEGNSVKMARIGGRCRSEDIQPYTLQALLRQHKQDKRYTLRYEQQQLNAKRKAMDLGSMAITQELSTVYPQKDEELKILELEDLAPLIHGKHVSQLRKNFQINEENKEIENWLFSAPKKKNFTMKENARGNSKHHQVQIEVEPSIAEVDAEAAMLENDRIIAGEQIELEPMLHDRRRSTGNTSHSGSPGYRHSSYDKIKAQQIKEGLKGKPMSERAVHNIDDITHLDYDRRWSLYQYWVSQYLHKCKQKVAGHAETYSLSCQEYQKAQAELNYAVLCDAHVVGATTTGAAKYHNIIQKMRPKIIIIEEAAEVLESHIVTTLTSSTQQVIMIGDHQQLRPKPNDYHLATDCNLEVSLFERLVKNKLPLATLEVQHRMRPAIAELVCPHIYPILINSPDVCDYESIRGAKHNVFFVSHANTEDDFNGELLSHSNQFEAEFCVNLCHYFIKLGYRHTQITILTMYTGQLLKMKKMMVKELFDGVRVCSVDNFQGEENDIIILSLVRSNAEKKIGFLKEINRLCVALSRAKMGLFVIGNFLLMKEEGGKEWVDIIQDMEKKGLVGNALPLYCSIHDKTTEVSSGGDFHKVPEGGCTETCGVRLSCGHPCPRACHPASMDHSKYNCKKKCNKELGCSHKCKKECWECRSKCGPCATMITKDFTCGHSNRVKCSANFVLHKCHKPCIRMLPCGHMCKELCHEPCKCKEIVSKPLPCGHVAKRVLCWKTPSDIKCREKCKEILSCGHRCSGDCHSCCLGRLHVSCMSHCGRTLSCGHRCGFPCTNECPPCPKPCVNYCNHSRCTRRCSEPCVPCMEECQWKCKHYNCTKLCGEMCSRPRCNQPCPKRLKCGHLCIGLCGETCPRWCRKCHKKEVTEIFFGTEDNPQAHFIQLEDCGHIFEVSGLDQWMDQQDSDTDSKAVEIQFKRCPKCKTGVRRSLRYGNIIKQTLRDMEEVKKRVDGNDVESERMVRTIQDSVFAMKHSLACIHQSIHRYIKKYFDGIESRAQLVDHSKGPHPTHVQSKPALHEINSLLYQSKNLPRIFKLRDATLKLNKEFEFGTMKICVKDIETHLLRLCDVMTVKNLTEQNKTDIDLEFNRLSTLLRLFQLCENLAGAEKVERSDLKFLNDSVEHLSSAGIRSKDKITAECVSELGSKFGEIRKKYRIGSISKQEKMEIVKAVGLSKGHWFKCPNGHYYCIGECGGAMQVAKCPECNASIGGMRHQLTAGNQHAPEMDNSHHPAWSDAANLQNYDPADIMDVN
ncbi:NFX1-type zinc finger-containing protein 1-like isoform X1 [Dysidea avara]|uniref:NFX1-type zinc finger-containing protein 1-like isoform X1 n=1 Tax=Dysidea avara TaxID=196820 RepID=UPI0033221937